MNDTPHWILRVMQKLGDSFWDGAVVGICIASAFFMFALWLTDN